MAISVTCACGVTLQAPRRLAGGSARCPACKEVIAVPYPDDDAISARPTATKQPKALGIASERQRPPAPHSRAALVGTIIVLLVIGTVFLGGGGLAAYWFYFKDDSKKSPSSRLTSASSSTEPSRSSGTSGAWSGGSGSFGKKSSAPSIPSWFSSSALPIGSGSRSVPPAALGVHEKYLPDSPSLITSYNLDRLRRSQLYQALLRANPRVPTLERSVLQQLGIPDDAGVRITVASCDASFVTIISVNGFPGLAAILAADAKNNGWPARKVADFDVYEVADGISETSPEGGVAIRGDSVLVDAILTRKGKAHFGVWLERALAAANFGQCCVSLMDGSFFGKDGGPGSLQGMMIARDLGDADYSMTMSLYYNDAASANANRAPVEAKFRKEHLPPRDGIISVTASGPTVTVVQILSELQAKNAAKQVLEGLTP